MSENLTFNTEVAKASVAQQSELSAADNEAQSARDAYDKAHESAYGATEQVGENTFRLDSAQKKVGGNILKRLFGAKETRPTDQELSNLGGAMGAAVEKAGEAKAKSETFVSENIDAIYDNTVIEANNDFINRGVDQEIRTPDVVAAEQAAKEVVAEAEASKNELINQ